MAAEKSDEPKVAAASPASQPIEVSPDALEEEPADAAKAYVGPRPVPKAALPAGEEAAKVVINLPDAEVVVEEGAGEQKHAQEVARQRRREPTVRIPRATLEAARGEIAAREARLNQEEEAAFGVPLPAATDDSIDVDPVVPKRSSRGALFAIVGGGVIAAIGGIWYLSRSASAPSAVAMNGDARGKAAVASAAPTSAKTAAPPIELTADPPAKTADPSVVTLNAAAADASATPTSEAGPTHSSPPPSVAMNGGFRPAAPTGAQTAPVPHAPLPTAQTAQPPVKPAAAPIKGYTPSSI